MLKWMKRIKRRRSAREYDRGVRDGLELMASGVPPTDITEGLPVHGWYTRGLRRSVEFWQLVYPKLTNYKRTERWLSACGVKQDAETQRVQIGCDLEETAEVLELIWLTDPQDREMLADAVVTLMTLSRGLLEGKANAYIPFNKRAAYLKELCDREVTGNAVCYAHGWNKRAADRLVLMSNDSKLENGRPVILPSGKIGKAEGWVRPDLSSCVDQ